MADANSTATNRDTFNRFYHLRALAMSAEALLNENADSDEALAIGYVLMTLIEKAEEFADLYTEYPINGGAAHGSAIRTESEAAHA